MKIKSLVLAILPMILCGCFNIPLNSTGKITTASGTKAASLAIDDTKEIATFDPAAINSTELTTPKVDSLKGASVSIAPGALSISVGIVVEQASDFGETSLLSESGIATDITVTSASAGLIVRPTTSVDGHAKALSAEQNRL